MGEGRVTGSTPSRAPGCRILRVDPENPDVEVLREAGTAIRRGLLVAFPTETVYGLGADAFNGAAVRRIFEVKGRPPDNPLIVHISSLDELWLVASSVPEEAYRLVEKLWPGPLTIVVPKDPQLPGVVSAGLPTVAVRMPAHPVALGLIRESGTPIAAPSANRSGRPSPTTANHVIDDLGCAVDVILDGGETFFGVESTIIDFTRDPPVLLRPGPYPVEKVEEILGKRVEVPPQARGLREAERPLAPGMKYRHYAPDTPVILIDCPQAAPEDLARALAEAASSCRRVGLRVAVGGASEVLSRALKLGVEADLTVDLGPLDRPEIAARRLFPSLRSLDEAGVDAALFAAIPERGVGLAVMNRLRKASTAKLPCEPTTWERICVTLEKRGSKY